MPPDRFDLPEENAIIVSAIVRLHVDAVESGPPAGTLSAEELRVLGDRLLRYMRLDTQLLVERRLRQLAEALERRTSRPE